MMVRVICALGGIAARPIAGRLGHGQGLAKVGAHGHGALGLGGPLGGLGFGVGAMSA
jgi:hypothetical protein